MTEPFRCRRCDIPKKPSEFHKNRAMVRGHHSICKDCANAAIRTRKAGKKKLLEKTVNVILEDDKPVASLETSLEDFDIEKENVVDGKLKHFTALFVAQSESGKTTLMMHLIKKIRKHYDLIILVTKNLQAEAYDLTKFDFYTNDVYLERVIHSLRYFQKSTNNMFNILLIIDDVKTRSKLAIQELYTNGRNSNITTWTLVQHPTMVDNHMRTNCKFIFLFNQKNPELIAVTTKYFLKNFVKVPKELRSRYDAEIYLEKWLQKNTENYYSVVLNIKSGVIQKVKAST